MLQLVLELPDDAPKRVTTQNAATAANERLSGVFTRSIKYSDPNSTATNADHQNMIWEMPLSKHHQCQDSLYLTLRCPQNRGEASPAPQRRSPQGQPRGPPPVATTPASKKPHPLELPLIDVEMPFGEGTPRPTAGVPQPAARGIPPAMATPSHEHAAVATVPWPRHPNLLMDPHPTHI